MINHHAETQTSRLVFAVCLALLSLTLGCQTGGNRTVGHRLVCTDGASAALGDSTTNPQAFSTTCTVPANYLTLGKTITIDAVYQMFTPAAAVSGLQLILQWNGTNIYANAPSQIPTANLINRGAYARWVILRYGRGWSQRKY